MDVGKHLLDLFPQDGEIWPLGHVHMLGREQKPLPQLFLQMALREGGYTQEDVSK